MVMRMVVIMTVVMVMAVIMAMARLLIFFLHKSLTSLP
jgi:hypothetical protein